MQGQQGCPTLGPTWLQGMREGPTEEPRVLWHMAQHGAPDAQRCGTGHGGCSAAEAILFRAAAEEKVVLLLACKTCIPCDPISGGQSPLTLEFDYNWLIPGPAKLLFVFAWRLIFFI